MKVTTDLRPTTEVDFEVVRDVSMAWVRLPDLTKLEAEMRRRGLEADNWSMEHKRRSDAAFRSELN